jgi:hypothetical protein
LLRWPKELAMTSLPIDRRTVLLGELGATTLTACGTGGGGTPGTPEGAVDGFLGYPANQMKAVSKSVGDSTLGTAPATKLVGVRHSIIRGDKPVSA